MPQKGFYKCAVFYSYTIFFLFLCNNDGLYCRKYTYSFISGLNAVFRYIKHTLRLIRTWLTVLKDAKVKPRRALSTKRPIRDGRVITRAYLASAKASTVSFSCASISSGVLHLKMINTALSETLNDLSYGPWSLFPNISLIFNNLCSFSSSENFVKSILILASDFYFVFCFLCLCACQMFFIYFYGPYWICNAVLNVHRNVVVRSSCKSIFSSISTRRPNLSFCWGTCRDFTPSGTVRRVLL